MRAAGNKYERKMTYAENSSKPLRVTMYFRMPGLASLVFSLLASLLFPPPVHSQWSHDPHVNNPVCTAAGHQTEPGIVTDGSGGAIITWEDYRTGIDSANIYAQRIDATGRVRWMTDGASISTARHTLGLPAIAVGGAAGAILTSEDNRQ